MPVPHFLETLLDRPIAFHRVFAELTNSLTAGIMLSQAIYWSKRTKDPNGWFYKSRDEWYTETYILRRAQENARAILRASRFGLASFWQEELRGVPARLFYRVDFDLLFQHLQHLHSEQSQNVPTGNTLEPDLTALSLSQYAPNVPTRRDVTYQLEGTPRTNKQAQNVPASKRKTSQHSKQRLLSETTSESSSSRRARARTPKTAAAAAASAFSETEILDYLDYRKPYNQNRNSGLAHKLYLTGEDDHLIQRWQTQRQVNPQPEPADLMSLEELRQEAARVGLTIQGLNQELRP